MMKRCFDFVLSLIGIIFFLPVFIVVAWVVRQDGGPAIFKQQRVGIFGRQFSVYKFRSMGLDAEKAGAKITAENDTRITRIGRIIRKHKIDELPQLFNVLSGDLSLVGPRPEVPYYVDKWPEKDRNVVLSVKPGITDYATLFYNDEQSILAKAEDPEKTYLEEIMPHKLKMNRQYVQDQNMCVDIQIIFTTLLKIAKIDPFHRFLGKKWQSMIRLST